MNLDQLQLQWENHDRKLDRLLKLNERAVRQSSMSRARTRLRWLGGMVIAGLVLSAGYAAFLAAFIAMHRGDARLLVFAAIVLAVVAIDLAFYVRQLALLARIDYAAPVVAIQKQLEAITILRVRFGICSIGVGAMTWPLPVIVVLAALGYDASGVGTGWLAANALVGLVVFAVLWLLRGKAALRKELGGQVLAAAKSHLEELARFEREP
jgi:hypothetical protein